MYGRGHLEMPSPQMYMKLHTVYTYMKADSHIWFTSSTIQYTRYTLRYVRVIAETMN